MVITAHRQGMGTSYVTATVTLPSHALQIPSVYDGDLHNEEEVLAWLIEQLHSDEIEDITDEMLDKLIRESNHLAVLFCEYGEKKNLKKKSLSEALFYFFYLFSLR